MSLLAVAGCVWWASNQERPTLPRSAGDFVLVGVALGVYAAAIVLRGGRWDVILDVLHVGHRRLDAYALTVVGYMGNTVLPARGGELLRIFLLAERSRAQRREVLGSILTERLLDVAALAVLGVVLVATGVLPTPSGLVLAVGVAGAVLVVVASSVAYQRFRGTPRARRVRAVVAPVLRATMRLRNVRGLALMAVTVAVWCLEGLVFWLVAESLGVGIGLADGLGVVVLASLSALIPAAPGYVGTYDAAALFALGQAGVSGGGAVGCVLLFRFVIFVPVTLLGLVVMVARYGGLRSAVTRERRHAPALAPTAATGAPPP